MKRDSEMLGLLLMAAALGVGRPRARRAFMEPFQTAEPCDPSPADLETYRRAQERRERRAQERRERRAARKAENQRRTEEGKNQ